MRTVRCSGLVMALVVMALLLGVRPASAAEVRGKIRSVDTAKCCFVLTASTGKDFTFECHPGCKDKLRAIRAGDQVNVNYEVQGGKIIALSVEKG